MKTMTLMKKLFTIWTLRDFWQVIDKLTRYKEDSNWTSLFSAQKQISNFKLFKLSSLDSWYNEDKRRLILIDKSKQIYFRCKLTSSKKCFKTSWLTSFKVTRFLTKSTFDKQNQTNFFRFHPVKWWLMEFLHAFIY